MIQRNHQRHGDDAQQRGDAVNCAGLTGVLTINHRHLGNSGRGWADGGEEADKDDGIAVPAEVRDARNFDKHQQNQRDKHQTQEGDEVNPFGEDDFFKRQRGNQHSGNEHGDGAYHAADGGERVVDDVRQFDLAGKHEHADKDGKDVDVGQYGFPRKIATPAKQQAQVRPEKEHLDDDEAAGVNHPLRSENGHHQRDDEVAGIGVNRGSVFERIELEQDFEKPAQRDQQDVELDRQGDREFQPVNDVGRVLDLESVNHHRRADEVERDDGERAAVFGGQKLEFHQRHAHQDDQGQLGDFAGEEQGGFHSLSVSVSEYRKGIL